MRPILDQHQPRGNTPTIPFLNPTPNIRLRYNAAPTDELPVVRLDHDRHRELTMLRWGLVPSWADDPKIGYSTLNARAETVVTKPAFREAFRRRRCLVLTDGFYEWEKVAGGTQPYRITMKDRGVRPPRFPPLRLVGPPAARVNGNAQ